MSSYWHILLFLAPALMVHDIHVSVCEIELQPNSMEMTLKTFLDDLQLAVGLKPGDQVPEQYTSADQMIEEYISSSMTVSVNKTDLPLKITDISAAHDAVWITIRTEAPIRQDDRVMVNSTYMTELYKDQTNIVNISTNKKKTTYTLNKKKTQISYEL
jgi:hypothetical protein